MSVGIYKIVLGKYYYIGSSNNIQRRITKHLQHLKENKHINKFLQNAYNKHRTKFAYEIIEETEEKKLLLIEQKYLDLYYGKEGCLNLTPVANKPPSARGRIWKPESIKKISNSKLGWKPSKTTIENMKAAARKRCKTVPFYLVSDTCKLGPFYTFKEVKEAGIMDDSSACELYNNVGHSKRKGYTLVRVF